MPLTVQFQGEAPGVLPTAGQQGYADLRINSHSSYGRFQVSGLAMDTAVKSGVGAFAGVMNEEMDRLVRDIANNENAINIFGGPTKGFLNQRIVDPNVSGANAQTAASGNISVDSRFVGYPDDLHLAAGSLCVDAGTSAVLSDSLTP